MFATGLVNLERRSTSSCPLNGCVVGLGTVEAAKNVHGVDASPGEPAKALVLWTDDVDAAFERLTSAGVPPASRA